LDPNAPLRISPVYNPNNAEYLLFAPRAQPEPADGGRAGFSVTYELPTDNAGTFTFAGDVSYYYKFEQENIPGEGMQDRLGDFIDPTQGLGWAVCPGQGRARHLLELQQLRVRRDRLLHPQLTGTTRRRLGATGKSTDIWTVDLQASYNFPKDLKVTVGVQNVADTEPPLVVAAFADNYDRDTHSLIGRFVYGQITKKF
jgi:outer membrane receptor protein involved in Fe transport